MTIWVDAQLSPEISTWIKTEFLFNCFHIREIGLLRANDKEIFLKARKEDNIIIVSKDKNFLDLLETYGPPPKIIWITTGNTSNKRLKEIFNKTLLKAIELFEKGENLVEIANEFL